MIFGVILYEMWPCHGGAGVFCAPLIHCGIMRSSVEELQKMPLSVLRSPKKAVTDVDKVLMIHQKARKEGLFS
jgi:hypothetical protein